ncbi:ArnT family glycosyltransferase [Thiohalospira halophila]|uniref:ArnT family glycosyltransferase n=1 Tax=Thiohalospira halophila TaxID=381300 RepID=UPI001180F879|nr:hypothetical protein [Thiohalospira halophila]
MSLASAGFGSFFLALKNSWVWDVVLVAFGVRALAALFHFYVAPLPDGTADAISFEAQAWEWARAGLWSALSAFPGIDSYFYAWCAALIYALTDRSLLLLQSINVFAGVLGVLVTWMVARELWGERAARKVAWVMALFPMVVQYGALPMREVWFVLFFMVGALGAIRWARGGGATAMGLTVGGFVAATFFHGGAIVGLLGFFGVLGAGAFRRWWAGVARGRLRVVASLAILGVLGLAVAYVVTGVSIHKLGTAEQMVSTERWMFYFESRVVGGARYPEWTQPQGATDFIWAVPLRAAYLLFAPFPWDLREPALVIGLIDALFYLALVVLVWRGRRAIWNDPGGRMLFLILVPLIFAYGVGTGNFGTGLRHRAKFAGALIALAAPHLPRLIWWRRSVPSSRSAAVPRELAAR